MAQGAGEHWMPRSGWTALDEAVENRDPLHRQSIARASGAGWIPNTSWLFLRVLYFQMGLFITAGNSKWPWSTRKLQIGSSDGGLGDILVDL